MLVAAIRTCCPRAGETAVGGTQAWHSGVGDWGTLRHPIPARGLCPLSRLRCHTLLGSCVHAGVGWSLLRAEPDLGNKTYYTQLNFKFQINNKKF